MAKRWGNTQKSQGKIRRWAKEYKADIDSDFDTDIASWMEVSARQLDASQIQAALQTGVLNESALNEIDEVGIENAVIYELESEAGSDNYQYAYFTQDDFRFEDLFRAKGKDQDQDEFSYFVVEIDTPGKDE